MRVLNAMLVPMVLYWCKTWTVQVFARVEGVMKLDKVRNVDIMHKLNQEAVTEIE